MKEAFLEPFLRKKRILKILPFIKNTQNCKLLDIGCGWDARLLKSIEPYVSLGVGIDFKAPPLQTEKIRTYKLRIEDTLPFENKTFNIVTMLAVLEHLGHPEKIVKEIDRILCDNGYLIITVPSKVSRPILEFLAFRLKIVSSEEIRDHKRYYNYKELKNLFQSTTLSILEHHYFQLGMNNFCVLKKGSFQ